MTRSDPLTISAEAQRTGYIKLSDAHRILSEDGRCCLETLQRLYTCWNCQSLSQKSFDQLKQSTAAASRLKQGKITVKRIISGNDERTAFPGETATSQADELLLRMAVWHWLLRIWSGFADSRENSGSALPLYCKTPSGTYAVISGRYAPSWYHYVRLSDLQCLFFRLEVSLPRSLKPDT